MMSKPTIVLDEDGFEVKYWYFDESDLEKLKGELLPYKDGGTKK